MVWNVSSFRPIKVEKDCAVMNYHTNYLLNATISLPLSLSSSLILLSLAPGMPRVSQTGNTFWEKTWWESTMDPLWNWNCPSKTIHVLLRLCLSLAFICVLREPSSAYGQSGLMEEDGEASIWTKGIVCRQYSSFQIFHFRRCLSSS